MLWYPVFQKLSSSQTVVFDVCLQYSSWDFNLNLLRSSYIRNFQKASVFSSYTQVYFNNHCLRTYLRSLLHAVLCNSKYIPTGRTKDGKNTWVFIHYLHWIIKMLTYAFEYRNYSNRVVRTGSTSTLLVLILQNWLYKYIWECILLYGVRSQIRYMRNSLILFWNTKLPDVRRARKHCFRHTNSGIPKTIIFESLWQSCLACFVV